MKKNMTIFACSIVGVLLCACSPYKQVSPVPGVSTHETKAQVYEIQTQETKAPEQPTQTQPIHQENETQPLRETTISELAQEKLSTVLSGQDSFFSPGYGKQMTIEEYCSTFGAESDITLKITKCAFVDLNQDNVPEAVLWVTVNEYSDYGTVVLRYQNESVVGYDFTYRQMIDLKKDGTFCYSGGVADTGCASLIFTEDSWEYYKIANVTEDEDSATFMCNGEVVSEAEYWQFMDEQDAKEGVEWIDF